VYMEFGVIHSFKYLLGSWNLSIEDKRGLCTVTI
jgi:hypothetical protein